MKSSKPLGLIAAEPQFARLLAAAFISGLGDQINQVAVLALVLALTHSGFAVAASLAARLAAYVAVGPLAGVLADRVSRRAILVASDLGRALLALAFIFANTSHQVWLVYLTIAALEGLSALFAPALTAAIPTLVRADNVIRANALDQSTLGVVMALGALAGGVLVAFLGSNIAFVTNSLSFVVSAALIAGMHIPRVSHRVQPSRDRRFRDVWPLIRASPVLRLVLALFAAWPVAGGAMNVLISVYGYSVFRAHALGVGLLYGALGAGLMLGGLTSGYLSRNLSLYLKQVAAGSFVIERACYFLTSRAPSLWLAAAGLLVATFVAGAGNICTTTLLMQNAQDAVRGRIVAVADTASNGGLFAGMLGTGALLAVVAPRTVGSAAGIALAAVGAVLSGLVRKMPAEDDDALPC